MNALETALVAIGVINVTIISAITGALLAIARREERERNATRAESHRARVRELEQAAIDDLDGVHEPAITGDCVDLEDYR